MIDELILEIGVVVGIDNYTKYDIGNEADYGPIDLNQTSRILQRHREFGSHVANIVGLTERLYHELNPADGFWNKFKRGWKNLFGSKKPGVMQIHEQMTKSVDGMNQSLGDLVIDSRIEFEEVSKYIAGLTDSRLVLNKAVTDYDRACKRQKKLYRKSMKAMKDLPEDSDVSIRLEQTVRRLQNNIYECDHKLALYTKKFEDAKAETTNAEIIEKILRKYIHNSEAMQNRCMYMYRFLLNHKNTFALFKMHSEANDAMLTAFQVLSDYTSEINDLFNEQLRHLEHNDDVYNVLSKGRMNNAVKSRYR